MKRLRNGLTVLLSSAGRRVGLLQCFRSDAQELGISLNVVAVDADPALSAACKLADLAEEVPHCSDSGFIPAVRRIVRREGVDLVIPTIDPELMAYAEAADLLASDGATVVVSSSETIAIARNKRTTAKFLHAAGVNVPNTMSLRTFLAEQPKWNRPVIVKPIDGSSSVGIQRLTTSHDLEMLHGLDADRHIVQELWEGDEYTVNLFLDRAGELRCAIPHRRIEVRAGEVSKGRTELVPPLLNFAERIASALPEARGALCYQAIVSPVGGCAVFELNARFGGGYPLAHAAGAPFTRWLLEEAAGIPSTATDTWRSGVTMLRYDAAIYC